MKHFPGHGSAPENSHTSAPVSAATADEFATLHLPPFRAAIVAGASGVMLGHFVVPAYDEMHPASQSAAIIEDLLRKDLGFEGLAVSDDLEMSAAAGRAGEIGTATPAQLGEAAVAALAAGCDLLITTGTFERQLVIRQAIVDAVTGGSLSAGAPRPSGGTDPGLEGGPLSASSLSAGGRPRGAPRRNAPGRASARPSGSLYSCPMIRLGVLCTILVVLGLGVAGCSPDTATHPETTNKQSTTKSSTATSTVRSTTTTDSEEALARAVLDKMTVRQKASQVLLLMFSGTTTISDELTEFLNETPPGGLMLFSKNVKSKAQVTALNTLLQKNARKGLPGVSMFIAADQEGGDVQRIREGVPDVPAARTVGTKWTPEKAGEVATQTAKGLRAQGVNMDLSPVATW